MADDKEKQNKDTQVRSPAEALRAAGMPNSTANQRKAKRAIEQMIMEGKTPTVRNFKQEMKKRQ